MKKTISQLNPERILTNFVPGLHGVLSDTTATVTDIAK